MAKERVYKTAAIPRNPGAMQYVEVAPGGRFFQLEDGAPFLAVGHNEAMIWPHMWPMHYEQDVATTEAYLKGLAEQGVTVIRIMLEYCADRYWFFEKPVGQMVPEAVLYWDDLVGLCERYGLRLLVIFWDTFFMSRRWEHHPYSNPGSGFDGPGSFCTTATALEAQKARIRLFVDRWGNSPAIFGYDLLNEIHPYWGGTPQEQGVWVTEIARFTKAYELERWGKRHLVTVSIFGSTPTDGYDDLILRHPELDFATTHVYQYGLVDNPDNPVDGALVMRDAVRYAFARMSDTRPYMDTESGPIHLFMDLHRQLDEPFDDEYYHNMSWAHLATGGAGSGMRWPFRDPHTLTTGMHAIQAAMTRFTPALDWTHFAAQPIDHLLHVVAHDPAQARGGAVPVVAFGCADAQQALVWLLRDTRHISPDAPLPPASLLLPGLALGDYTATFWDTYAGAPTGHARFTVGHLADGPTLGVLVLPPFARDLALAVQRDQS